MYKVYFDNIEQNEDDILNINSIISFTLVREDGITSTEQILREKTEMELQFTGCAYDYICERIQIDKCNEIDFSIEDTDTGISFNGVINVSLCELQIAKRIGKTKIKDTSFSAYIRDYLDTDVSLFASLTKGCQNLDDILENFVLKSAPGNLTSNRTVVGFDVLKVFQFLVNYHTDNTINVVSTYLTNNKYMITTGANMTLAGTTSEMIYPEISINGLFQELRKKLRLYMGIEYTVSGVPYLLIEQEDNFYANTPIITIPDVPINLVQSYDLDRNFNRIEMGSETTEMADEATEIYYPQKRFTAWNAERYLSCGTCLSNKESSIDAVSQYIIDSNIIYEALAYTADDYKYNDNIFLIHYRVDSGVNTSYRTLVSGTYVYNISINNENSLANWIDYFGKCITLSSYPKNGFWIQNKEWEALAAIVIVDGLFTFCQKDRIPFTYVGYDNEATIQHYTGNITTSANLCFPETPGVSADFDYFEVLADGNYIFIASVANFRQLDLLGDNFPLDFMISIDIYDDDSFTTILTSYTNTVTGQDALNDGINISVTTGSIPLVVGNCILVSISYYCASGDAAGGNITHGADLIDLRMIADSNSCNQQNDDNQNSKPYVVDFDHPICAQDYILMRENKSGYITIKDNQYWIKEVTYKPGLSKFKLIGNESLC